MEKGSKRVSDGSSGVSMEDGGRSEEGDCGRGRSAGVLSGLNKRGGWTAMGGRCGVSSSRTPG